MRFVLIFLLLNKSLGLNINSRRDIFRGLIHSQLLFNKNDVSKDFDLNYLWINFVTPKLKLNYCIGNIKFKILIS